MGKVEGKEGKEIVFKDFCVRELKTNSCKGVLTQNFNNVGITNQFFKIIAGEDI